MSKLDLAAIRAREQNATKGPWVYERSGPVTAPTMFEIAPPGADGCADWSREVAATTGGDAQDEANAAFIVHARADIQDLVEEVEKLRAELDPSQRDGSISLASMLQAFAFTTEKGEPPTALDLRECAAAAKLLQVRMDRLRAALVEACDDLDSLFMLGREWLGTRAKDWETLARLRAVLPPKEPERIVCQFCREPLAAHVEGLTQCSTFVAALAMPRETP